MILETQSKIINSPTDLKEFINNSENIEVTRVVLVKSKTYIYYKLKNIKKEDVIISILCDYFSITPEVLKSRSNKRGIVEPRHLCIVLLCNFTNLTYSSIGQILGGFDHSLINHAKTTIKNSIETDKETARKFNELNEKIIKKLK